MKSRHSRPISSFLRTPLYVGWNLQYRPTLISTNKIKRIDPCLLSEENSLHSMVRVRNVLKLASLSLGSGVSDLSPANYATGIPRRFLSHICAGEASWLHFGWKFTFSRQPCCSYDFQCLQDPLVFWCCGLGHVRSKLNKPMNGSKGKLTQTIVMLNHYYPTNAIIRW